jgi:hypothetical protein
MRSLRRLAPWANLRAPGTRAFAGVLGAMLLAGCASVPSGSQVVGGRVTSHQQPIDDPYVRVIPVGPGRDWDPGTMVTAFQAA